MKPAVFVLIPLAVGLAPPVFAQDDASEAGAANAPIVVTGQRIEDSLAALEADAGFLLKGDVFTQDVLDMWTEYKRDKEINPVKLRPHPHEFTLYYDI